MHDSRRERKPLILLHLFQPAYIKIGVANQVLHFFLIIISRNEINMFNILTSQIF